MHDTIICAINGAAATIASSIHRVMRAPAAVARRRHVTCPLTTTTLTVVLPIIVKICRNSGSWRDFV